MMNPAHQFHATTRVTCIVLLTAQGENVAHVLRGLLNQEYGHMGVMLIGSRSILESSAVQEFQQSWDARTQEAVVLQITEEQQENSVLDLEACSGNLFCFLDDATLIGSSYASDFVSKFADSPDVNGLVCSGTLISPHDPELELATIVSPTHVDLNQWLHGVITQDFPAIAAQWCLSRTTVMNLSGIDVPLNRLGWNLQFMLAFVSQCRYAAMRVKNFKYLLNDLAESPMERLSYDGRQAEQKAFAHHATGSIQKLLLSKTQKKIYPMLSQLVQLNASIYTDYRFRLQRLAPECQTRLMMIAGDLLEEPDLRDVQFDLQSTLRAYLFTLLLIKSIQPDLDLTLFEQMIRSGPEVFSRSQLKNGVILHGAGAAAGEVLEVLTAAGWRPAYVMDRNGDHIPELRGYEVHAPGAVPSSKFENAVVIIAVGDKATAYLIANDYWQTGAAEVLHIPDFHHATQLVAERCISNIPVQEVV